MKYIKGSITNTIIINKSEFITNIFRVNSISEIEEILANIRKKYYDATHNCYAYVLGDQADIQKSSDDGEPAKTAGALMLDVIKKQRITNILAIVTRYYGGIMLGAGGLTRAYSQSVSEALSSTKFYYKKEQMQFSLTTSYSGYNTIIKTIPYIQIEQTSFQSEVIIQGFCDKELFEQLKKDLYSYKIDCQAIIEQGNSFIELPFDTSS